MREVKKVPVTQSIENNTIFKIDDTNLVQDTLKVYNKNGDIAFQYLGGGYLQIEGISLNETFTIEFEIEIQNINSKTLEERVKTLEDLVSSLTEQNEILFQALRERVDKHSFRVWLKAVESKMGVQILEKDLLGVEGVNSYRK